MWSRKLASVEVTEFHVMQAYTTLDLTSVKYNMKRLSTDENENVITQIRP
jgi:hypothetical protein